MSSTVTKAKNSKQISCKVRMLDDQELPFHIDPKATGQDLFTIVCNFIDLLENDYFALEYLDSHRNSCWLEMDKPVLKQVTETKFSFCVKFYTPDPGQLEEEFTRYLFALQIKRDLLNGTLLCSDNTATLLASYIVQAEIGDYLESYNNNTSYFSGRKFFPHQTSEHEARIMNLHKNHIGQLPVDADLNLLDIARKVELYGIKMHPAKDHEQVNLNLSVAHMGILVFQHITKINTFSWAKIRKLSFKRKKFLIKLQPEGYGYYKDTVEFYFDTRDECKNFWKKCIEYHAFFRCVTIKRAPRSRSKLLTRGSSFRYFGRTQKEMIEYAREHYVKNRTFTRSYSGTRVVAPVTNRAHRSPGSALKNSDTMRSQETNASSMESSRLQSRSVPISTNQTNQVSSTKTNDQTDTILSTTPNDAYQHVYHDDSSTHGSRTLDSRFSRDKYDLSDDETSDEDDEKNKVTPIVDTSNKQTIEKPVNGSASPTITSSVLVHADHQSSPTVVPTETPTTTTTAIAEIEPRRNSKVLNESDENDKGKSPGVEKIYRSMNVTNEDGEEEDHSESNHKRENEISVEIYHYNKNDEQEANNPLGKRYSASLKMYVHARDSSDVSESIHKSTTDELFVNKFNNQEPFGQHMQSISLQIDRSISMDFTHSPSGSSSTSSSPSIEHTPLTTVGYLLGANVPKDQTSSLMNSSTPPVVAHIRRKPPSLPKMADFIEYVDRRALPDKDSLSWQDDTIDENHVQSSQEAKPSTAEDSIELVRELIESMVTKIVEQERQLFAVVDRIVNQACSRALNLYRIEHRMQSFAGASHLPHHKSCMLRSDKTKKSEETNTQDNNGTARYRTKSSPAIAMTTDWTDVSRKLASQTCFAAYPSGSNIHQLERSEFSTFSEAKLKFFNIIPNNDVVPSRSTVSLPHMAHVSIGESSSSSTRSSRASSVSSYASSMHVPCPPIADNLMKRPSRPLSARLLDLSDDSDSNLSTSISASFKTSTLPTMISTSHSLPSHSPLPPLPQTSPALRTQRRHHRPQQQRGRSNEDSDSSSDDSLSNHLNKAAGFRSVFVPRNSSSTNQEHRRQITGFVSSQRKTSGHTSGTPPRRSSTNEQQSISVTQRLSLTKQNVEYETIDSITQTKRSSISETHYRTSTPTSNSCRPDFLAQAEETISSDDPKNKSTPIIHEYRSPTTTLSAIESRTSNHHQQSPSKMISPASCTINPTVGGIPKFVGTVQPTILPTSVSSTMIITTTHDQAFFICKELLMTERTYKKDIELIAEHFRREFCSLTHRHVDHYVDDEHFHQENEALTNFSDLLFTNLVPIYHFHNQYLRQLEQRMSLWESRSMPNNDFLSGEKTGQHIGDLISNLVEVLPRYENYVENYGRILNELEYLLKRYRRFDSMYKEFESQKFCYLSFISFLLKPLQRLLHYEYLLEKLLLYYRETNRETEYQDCYGIYIKIQDYIENFSESLLFLQNRQKLIELQRDLIGVDNLSIQNDREFIREGCLQKLSRKGYQQRMFFLFSDVLLYCARSSSPVLQFKLHGELPLKLMNIEDSEERLKIPNSITIHTGTRSLLVAANSEAEKLRWFNDLKSAIEKIKIDSEEHKNQYTSTLKSNASSENLDHPTVAGLDEEQTNSIERSCIQHRANTTMHVCWHRNLSVSMPDHRQSIKNQLSGYLLRKFKNSNGWQKLWVVFTNFCLFFYKTYQDDFPLASLPLLGYRSSLPAETDGVNKDYVFKLQFKNHVYFFRAESQYAFDRWMEVVASATVSSANLIDESR